MLLRISKTLKKKLNKKGEHLKGFFQPRSTDNKTILY